MPKTVLHPPERPTAAPEPQPLAHDHVPPGWTPRDYTNQATTVLTCCGCGLRAGWRTREPFSWVKATTAARKAGWHPLPSHPLRPQRWACTAECAFSEDHVFVRKALDKLTDTAAATLTALRAKG